MHAALLHQGIPRLQQHVPRFRAAEEEDFSTWTEAFHLATLSDRCVPGKRQRGHPNITCCMGSRMDCSPHRLPSQEEYQWGSATMGASSKHAMQQPLNHALPRYSDWPRQAWSPASVQGASSFQLSRKLHTTCITCMPLGHLPVVGGGSALCFDHIACSSACQTPLAQR